MQTQPSELMQKNKIMLLPAHTPVQMNEKANEPARKRAFVRFLGPKPLSDIGANTIRKVLRDNERANWA